jgi:hypothetical protein
MSVLRYVSAAGVAAVLVLGLAACSSPDDPTGSTQGTLRVDVHDAPDASSLTKAEVTFSSLEAHAVGGSWVPAQGTFPQTVDLLQYTGPDDSTTLVQDLVPVGSYDQLRVGITAVHLEFEDGTVIDVPLPSGGVQFAVSVAFSVTEGGETEVDLDFPPNAVFQPAGSSWSFNGSGVAVSRVR